MMTVRVAASNCSCNFQNPETSAGFNPKAASDWSVVIISALPFSVTRSRGEYLRVVGIREIPDHATFREKCVNTGLVRQTWDMSLFGPM